jgi:hypothetical protein
VGILKRSTTIGFGKDKMIIYESKNVVVSVELAPLPRFVVKNVSAVSLVGENKTLELLPPEALTQTAEETRQAEEFFNSSPKTEKLLISPRTENDV